MVAEYARRPYGPHAQMRMMANLNWSLHFIFGSIVAMFAKEAAYEGSPEDFLPWARDPDHETRQSAKVGGSNSFFGIPDEEDE